jgi:hypothetical protein
MLFEFMNFCRKFSDLLQLEVSVFTTWDNEVY